MPFSDADRERQRAVLTKLRKSTGLSPTTAAGRIGVSYSQLLRYEEGLTLLPTNYFAAVAGAYGITKADLSARLGLIDDARPEHPVPPDGPLDQMLAAIGMPAAEIRELTASVGSGPTTPEERATITRFVADVLRKRVAPPEQARRRA